MTVQQFKETYTKQIECYKEALKVLDIIAKESEKFNGKVMNKRYSNTLNEILKPMEVCVNYTNGFITYVRFIIMNETRQSPAGWYVPQYSFDIEICSAAFINDNRLNYEAFLECVDCERKRITKRIENTMDVLTNLDEYMTKYETAFRECGKILKQIPELIRPRLHLVENNIDIPYEAYKDLY